MCKLCDGDGLYIKNYENCMVITLHDNKMIFKPYIQTLEWSDYNDDYEICTTEFECEINKCPMCGRKLKGE